MEHSMAVLDFRTPSASYLTLKRVLDVAIAAFGLLAFAPFMALIGLAVKLSSPGPAIFRQKRVGLLSREFVILKFRTMYQGTESEDLYTRRNDSRVTSLGKLLRPYHLDELPQLLNVIKGDMSMVGPRPRPVQQYKNRQKLCPNYSLRERIKPGLTGLEQLENNYDLSDRGIRESYRLDMLYLQTCSLATDLRIILRTFAVVIRGKGV